MYPKGQKSSSRLPSLHDFGSWLTITTPLIKVFEREANEIEHPYRVSSSRCDLKNVMGTYGCFNISWFIKVCSLVVETEPIARQREHQYESRARAHARLVNAIRTRCVDQSKVHTFTAVRRHYMLLERVIRFLFITQCNNISLSFLGLIINVMPN